MFLVCVSSGLTSRVKKLLEVQGFWMQHQWIRETEASRLFNLDGKCVCVFDSRSPTDSQLPEIIIQHMHVKNTSKDALKAIHFQTSRLKHPKFKRVFYCTLVYICICRFRMQSIFEKFFLLHTPNFPVLFLSIFWRSLVRGLFMHHSHLVKT